MPTKRPPRAGKHDTDAISAEAAPDVGPTLRALRDSRGLSLEKLAQLTGVSRAMLGQIELGQSVPTIKTMWRISKALDVPFSSLIQKQDGPQAMLLPLQNAKLLTNREGTFTSRALFPFGEPRKVEFYEIQIKAKSSESAEAHAAGTVENLVVSKGHIQIEVGDEVYDLNKGDALVFEADRPHVYKNPSENDALFYMVVTYTTPTA